MAKKIVKKRKLRVGRFLFILVILGGLFFGGYNFVKLPIENIIISGTKYLNDDYILELSNLKDYPSFMLTSRRKTIKRLEKSPYINSAKVKKKFFHKIVIEVEENKPLFYSEVDKKIVFSNKESIDVDDYSLFRVPRLLNYVPDTKYNSFIKNVNKVDEEILGMISDIEYVPNDLDKDRFLLYMDDGNMVYLTLTKFKMINYYNDVLAQLEGRKGILYLDNGNHFQIKE